MQRMNLLGFLTVCTGNIRFIFICPSNDSCHSIVQETAIFLGIRCKQTVTVIKSCLGVCQPSILSVCLFVCRNYYRTVPSKWFLADLPPTALNCFFFNFWSIFWPRFHISRGHFIEFIGGFVSPVRRQTTALHSHAACSLSCRSVETATSSTLTRRNPKFTMTDKSSITVLTRSNQFQSNSVIDSETRKLQSHRTSLLTNQTTAC